MSERRAGRPTIAGGPTRQRGARARPTLADIAREIGVTPTAVSLALNGRPGVSATLREQIMTVAAQIGYRPNPAAVALRTERSGVMGVINRNLRNPAFLDVIEGFDYECARHGYEVMSGSAHFDQDRERALVATFADRQVDGLAIAPIGGGAVVRDWLRRTGKPVVIINADNPIRDRRVMTVRAAVNAVMPDIVAHLTGLGHRHVALLAAPAEKSPDPQFIEAFRAEADRHGIRATVIESELELDAARATLRDRFRRSGRQRITALVTDSDYMAQAAYLAARDAGLAVPDDISIVGQGDVPTSQLLDPPLTTLPIDAVELGAVAARQLLQSTSGQPPRERHVELPTRLLVRASTATPRRR